MWESGFIEKGWGLYYSGCPEGIKGFGRSGGDGGVKRGCDKRRNLAAHHNDESAGYAGHGI
ncbi:MAG TPA: hypothetical protein PLK80_17965, partial [bacterium]|nr:hypothetical protein [bacterium]